VLYVVIDVGTAVTAAFITGYFGGPRWAVYLAFVLVFVIGRLDSLIRERIPKP
jgi:uncharacterized membrane protein YjjP (DUF1212 family)